MKTYIPYHLIHKDFTGEISLEESIKLHAWLEKDHEHEVLFDNILDVWDASKLFKPLVEFPFESALTNFKDKIQTEVHNLDETKVFDIAHQKENIKTKSKVVQMSRRWSYSAIAAGFAIVLGSFVVWKTVIHNPLLNVKTGDDETTLVQLYDNSTILLHENSSVAYYKKYDSDKRQVSLNGKAHFDIERNEKLPFEVKTKAAFVQVLGTEFTVDDHFANQIAVNVSEGLVRLTDDDSDESINIAVGNMAVLNTQKNTILSKKISTRVVNALKKGKISFIAASFEETITDLEAIYNIHVDYDPKQFVDFSWTINNFDFTKSSAADIFPIINKALNDGTHLELDSTDEMNFRIIRK